LLRRAIEQEPDPKDKIRRTRFVIVRNTMPQLKATSMKTIQELLRGVAVYRAQDHSFDIKFGDVESEWIMLPLDTPENVQRLLSLDLTGGWLSELRELPPQILLDVFSRCGRYPSKMNGGPSWYGVIGETNSFSEDSPWNAILEEKDLMRHAKKIGLDTDRFDQELTSRIYADAVQESYENSLLSGNVLVALI